MWSRSSMKAENGRSSNVEKSLEICTMPLSQNWEGRRKDSVSQCLITKKRKAKPKSQWWTHFVLIETISKQSQTMSMLANELRFCHFVKWAILPLILKTVSCSKKAFWKSDQAVDISKRKSPFLLIEESVDEFGDLGGLCWLISISLIWEIASHESQLKSCLLTQDFPSFMAREILEMKRVS